MLFLTLSNIKVNFQEQKLWQKTYITQKALPTIRCGKLGEKNEFATAALDLKHKIFMIYLVLLTSPIQFIVLKVYLSYRAQIVSLIVKKAFTKIFAKYVNFAIIFFLDLVFKLFKYIEINNYAINLVNGQQPPNGPIYGLGFIKLKTLKAYIKTKLANSSISLFKSFVNASILYDQKLDGSLQLYVNY